MAPKNKKKPDPVTGMQQQAHISGGDSYQAGGDIYIGKTDEPAKPVKKLDTAQKWLALVISITVIITFIFALPKMVREFSGPESARFYGVVVDEDGEAVAGAEIVVQEKEGDKIRLGFDKTQANGEFSFSVKAKPEATLWVTVSKDGRVGFQGYQSLLGNVKISFKAEK